MRNIDVLKIIFSLQFCMLIIIIHLTCIDRTFAKYTQNQAEVHNAKLIQISTSTSSSTQKAQNFSRLEQLKVFRWRIKNCIEHTKNTTWSCFKINSLRAFDELTTAAVIPIWNGMRFVRLNENQHTTDFKIKDDKASYQRQDLKHLTWFDSLAMRLAKILHTHILELNLKEMTDAYMENLEQRTPKSNLNSNESVGEARGRRHRYNMMMTMMFGVTALGAVLVPMGFQFLSVVSGKALLLAKMALLLASINGLKKIANSGVHYGLYQVPGEHYGGYGGYYERNDLHHPRNVALAQPVEFGIRK